MLISFPYAAAYPMECCLTEIHFSLRFHEVGFFGIFHKSETICQKPIISQTCVSVCFCRNYFREFFVAISFILYVVGKRSTLE
mmetsp:Transcript_97129/g.197314  ORF Transcript_97129/g.197314 Transcript_97129/m.197314 type:complete len:83 (-) Transcript_97129:183-431(-)